MAVVVEEKKAKKETKRATFVDEGAKTEEKVEEKPEEKPKEEKKEEKPKEEKK
jgi:hypothetical protein